MAALTTSLVVNFGGNTSGILSAEIDSRPTGRNKGNTSFVPSDTVYFLVYTTANVAKNPITLDASYGAPLKVGTGTEVITETLTYTGSNVATTSKPIKSGFSSLWLGNNVGAVTTSNENEVRVAVLDPLKKAGVLQVTYTTSFDIYSIASPLTMNGLANFSIVVIINGTAT